MYSRACIFSFSEWIDFEFSAVIDNAISERHVIIFHIMKQEYYISTDLRCNLYDNLSLIGNLVEMLFLPRVGRIWDAYEHQTTA